MSESACVRVCVCARGWLARRQRERGERWDGGLGFLLFAGEAEVRGRVAGACGSLAHSIPLGEKCVVQFTLHSPVSASLAVDADRG